MLGTPSRRARCSTVTSPSGDQRVAAMKIQVWSDVICPWCYVGKRNLERALANFEDANAVQIEWKSYELAPDAPARRSGSYVEHISKKYGISVGEARARMARIVSLGADAGIEF